MPWPLLMAAVGVQGVLIWQAWRQRLMMEYLMLLLPVLVLALVGLYVSCVRMGNPRLVVYTMTLLSVGQLIQAILQQGDGFESYRKSILLFLAVAAALAVLVWFGYGWVYYLMAHKRGMWIFLALCIICCMILLIWGQEEYGAKLWLSVGGISIQLTEIIKVLFILTASSILCVQAHVSTKRQILFLFFCGGITVGFIAFFNEFGTALILGLTGLVLLYLFQSSRAGKATLAVTLLVVAVAGTVWGTGYQMYQRIPMVITSENFSSQLSATADTEGLAKLLRENTNEIREEVEEAGLTIDIAKTITFIERELQQAEVDNSYPKKRFSETDALAEAVRQKRYLNAVATLANSRQFRLLFQEAFLEQSVHIDRMCGAFTDHYKNGQGKLSLGRTAQQQILKIYAQIDKATNKLQQRFAGVLSPGEEANNNSYQTNKGKQSMLTGGLLGNGKEVVMKRGVYAADSDMVFAMIVSELGGLTGIFVILLNMLIFREAVEIALQTTSKCQKGMCIGIGVSWLLQALIIIGGNCQWIPLTGITLPLIANGGSSLVVSIVCIVLLELAAEHPVQESWNARRILRKKKPSGKYREWMEAFTEQLRISYEEDEDEEEEIPRPDPEEYGQGKEENAARRKKGPESRKKPGGHTKVWKTEPQGGGFQEDYRKEDPRKEDPRKEDPRKEDFQKEGFRKEDSQKEDFRKKAFRKEDPREEETGPREDFEGYEDKDDWSNFMGDE